MHGVCYSWKPLITYFLPNNFNSDIWNLHMDLIATLLLRIYLKKKKNYILLFLIF
jgi:hypothetical protein